MFDVFDVFFTNLNWPFVDIVNKIDTWFVEPIVLSYLDAEDKNSEKRMNYFVDQDYVLSNVLGTNIERPTKRQFVEQNFIDIDYENIDNNHQEELEENLVKNPFFVSQRNGCDDSDTDIVMLWKTGLASWVGLMKIFVKRLENDHFFLRRDTFQ